MNIKNEIERLKQERNNIAQAISEKGGVLPSSPKLSDMASGIRNIKSVDLSSDTVTPNTIFEGITAHNSDNESIIGTFTIQPELNEQSGIIDQIKSALQGKGFTNSSDDTVTPETLFKGEIAHQADGYPIVGSFDIQPELIEQGNIINQIKSALQGKGTSGEGIVVPTKPEQTKELDVIDNGNYNILPDDGCVLSKAVVNVAVPKQKPEVEGSQTISINGSQTFVPPTGSVFKNFTVDVQTPVPKVEETKMVKYASNGKRDITPTNGKVMSKVSVEVAVPSDKKPEQVYNQTYTKNGDYPIIPNSGNVINGGTIKVDCPVPKEEQTKTINIKDDGTFKIVPDGGKVLTEATVIVKTYTQKYYKGTVIPPDTLGSDGDIYFQKTGA